MKKNFILSIWLFTTPFIHAQEITKNDFDLILKKTHEILYHITTSNYKKLNESLLLDSLSNKNDFISILKNPDIIFNVGKESSYTNY